MTHLRLTDIYCYYSKTFSLVYDGSTLEAYRERDKMLIASIPIRNESTLYEIFHDLKNKLILDYDNML